jgi:hypothetical protein
MWGSTGGLRFVKALAKAKATISKRLAGCLKQLTQHKNQEVRAALVRFIPPTKSLGAVYQRVGPSFI